MQITIEVSDFYLDEDQDIAQTLKHAIANEAVKQIRERFIRQIDELKTSVENAAKIDV